MLPYNGFTLIELIVVIAILAILALIAIPRFAGFTDKAKKQTDDQYAALVGNSAVVMLAAGDIKFTESNTTGTLTIDDATGTVSVDASVITGAAFPTSIEKLVNKKPLQFYKNDIKVEINDKGDYTINTTP